MRGVHSTGGLRPPLVVAARSFVRGKPPFAMHKRTSGQERRSSARRGSRYQRCATTIEYRSATDERTTTRSGGREPAVVRDTDAVPREPSIVPRPTNGQRRAAGVSPPWFAERDYRGSCIANHLQTRVASYGWLTPAAPGCTVLVTEEITTFAVQKRSFSRAVGVSSWPETVANSAGTLQTRAWFASGRFSMLAAIPRGAEFCNPRYVVCIRTVFDVRRKTPAKKP
jgi:hypothetical protein